MDESIARAARCARRYRELGLSPLPSRTDRKSPSLPSYAEYRTRPLEDRYFTPDGWGTPNVQLLTGRQAYGTVKVLVVDCDGAPALERWRQIADARGGHPPTWVVVTGSGGTHTYFRVPDGADAVATGLVWGLWDTWGRDGRGGWAKHHEVKVLGDGAQAVAPPSLHVETGQRYQFGPVDPVEAPLPAVAPDWLLALPRLGRPRFDAEPALTPEPRARKNGFDLRGHYDRQLVLSVIPDKPALARQWGLRFAGRLNPNGWIPCHAAGREDGNPSASFHAEAGVYQDMATGEKLSLFDLAVRLGAFADWREAVAWCAERHHVKNPYSEAVAVGSRGNIHASK